jgi:hypothetical protein
MQVIRFPVPFPKSDDNSLSVFEGREGADILSAPSIRSPPLPA